MVQIIKKNHKRDQKIKFFKEIQENITFIKQEDDREETQILNEKNLEIKDFHVSSFKGHL